MDINITYEDGLRLSELRGQLAQFQYNLDHIDLTALPYWLATCAVIGFGLALLSSWLYISYTERKEIIINGRWTVVKRRDVDSRIWTVGTFVAATLICMLACMIMEAYLSNSIQSDMSNVQAQIDAILSKYGS